jgi:hypothetical protein
VEHERNVVPTNVTLNPLHYGEACDHGNPKSFQNSFKGNFMKIQ